MIIFSEKQSIINNDRYLLAYFYIRYTVYRTVPLTMRSRVLILVSEDLIIGVAMGRMPLLLGYRKRITDMSKIRNDRKKGDIHEKRNKRKQSIREVP